MTPDNKKKYSCFHHVYSDGWGNRVDVVQGVESAIAGSISLMLYSPKISQFASHYASLGPDGSPNNPWFKEFWEEKFQCSLDGKSRRHDHRCTGELETAGILNIDRVVRPCCIKQTQSTHTEPLGFASVK